MSPEVQAFLFVGICGVAMVIFAAWGPITRKVFPVLTACSRLLRALAQRYLNLPELRRIMSTNEQDGKDDQAIVAASQSTTTKNDEVTTKKEERDDVDIMIQDAVYRAQVETAAKILHFARQQNKKLPETRILEDIFKVSSGSNKKWYSVHGDVMRELAKHAPVEEEKSSSADRMVAVSNNRMVVPEAMTEKDKQAIEEKQLDKLEPEETDNDDALKYKPLLA